MPVNGLFDFNIKVNNNIKEIEKNIIVLKKIISFFVLLDLFLLFNNIKIVKTINKKFVIIIITSF